MNQMFSSFSSHCFRVRSFLDPGREAIKVQNIQESKRFAGLLQMIWLLEKVELSYLQLVAGGRSQVTKEDGSLTVLEL